MSIKSIIIINGFVLDEKKLAQWAIDNNKYTSLYHYIPPDYKNCKPEEVIPGSYFPGWYEYFCEHFVFDEKKFNKCMPTYTVQGFHGPKPYWTYFGPRPSLTLNSKYIFGMELIRYPVRQIWEKEQSIDCKTDNGIYNGNSVVHMNPSDLCAYCYNHIRDASSHCNKCGGEERLTYEKPKLPKSLENCISDAGIFIIPEQVEK
jgi:hypothetical protein